MLSPFVLDDPIVDTLETEQTKCVSVEAAIHKLEDINRIILESGMSANLASAINDTDPAALESLHPKSFTAQPSIINVTESLEGIFKSIGNFLKNLASMTMDFIIRALEWLLSKVGHMKNTDELKATTKKYEKVDDYSKELTSKTRERLQALESTPEHDELITIFEEILSGAHPEVAEAIAQAKSTYSKLVRSSMISTGDTLKLLDFSKQLGTVDIAFEATVKNFTSLVMEIHEASSIPEIQSLLSLAASLHDNFQASLVPIAKRIKALRLYGITMPDLDTDEPELFFAALRTNLITAAMTTDTHSVEEDIPDVKDRTDTIIELAKVSDQVFKQFAKRKSEYESMMKSVKKLRKLTKDPKFGQARILENEDRVREALILVNRRLRGVILSVMRLREIPEIYSKAHSRFISRQGYALVTQSMLIKDL